MTVAKLRSSEYTINEIRRKQKKKQGKVITQEAGPQLEPLEE